MRTLITGETGFLGPYLKTALPKDIFGISSKVCDLTDPASTKRYIGSLEPEMIIHAAARTDVDGCEKQPNLAVRDNCGMVENIVKYMNPDCRFVYISTDMVYSGIGPHKEHSKSENPINMYGMSKFMGEYSAAKAKNHLIVRTNMYGKALTPRKSSLVDFLLGKLKEGSAFNVFTDSLFSPLWAKTLADNLVKMARSTKIGTFNLGSTGGMSKAKFAMLLADGMGLSPQGMRPVDAASIQGRVPRPLDTRMDLMRTEMVFGLALPSMESDIKAMCEHLKCTH